MSGSSSPGYDTVEEVRMELEEEQRRLAAATRLAPLTLTGGRAAAVWSPASGNAVDDDEVHWERIDQVAYSGGYRSASGGVSVADAVVPVLVPLGDSGVRRSGSKPGQTMAASWFV
jgi:hypothetical protein